MNNTMSLTDRYRPYVGGVGQCSSETEREKCTVARAQRKNAGGGDAPAVHHVQVNK